MKSALLLFSKTSSNSTKAYPADLAGLLNKAGEPLHVTYGFLDDIIFALSPNQAEAIDTTNNRPLDDYDVIYFRHWSDVPAIALAAARFCRLRQVPFVDSEVLRVGSHNKITQYMNLYEADIPFPKTLIAVGRRLLQCYKQYEFAFPFILKSASGSRGQDNYLIRSESEMEQVIADHPAETFVLQAFIPNEGDYRVLVMGDKVVGVIGRKASTDTHLNNTSQGGSATWLPIATLPPEVLALCVRAARFFGRDVAGVDIVQSTADNRYYCFEVNRAPQIEHASFEKEKAELLAQYLVSLAR